ncbi:MAG: hypothetical protein QOE84_412 [Actinomycetota bacterium]|jgi:hypothetical protein|nr:hypothetical protein [Actinomycetota bacterium]
MLRMGAVPVENPRVSSSGYGYSVAPRTVDVLPSRVSRRVTRRDGLLPLLLALELAAGVAFGIAGASGAAAASTPAKVVLGAPPLVTVLPSTHPVAMVQPIAVATVGPAVGPLVPGTLRAPLVEPPVVTVVPTSTPLASPTPYPKHAARDPFLSLVRG